LSGRAFGRRVVPDELVLAYARMLDADDRGGRASLAINPTDPRVEQVPAI